MTRFSITVPVALVFLLLVGAPADAQNGPAFMWGSPAPATAGQRIVVVDGGTRWVNVETDESVHFVLGAVEFAWRFDGPGTRPFDLRQIAPAGSLARPVTVYITRLITDTPGDVP